jgi:ABC-type cobalamin/Fe3+-siderophores transport system ATPase subunit
VADKFMLSNLLERDINTLSGGERKRVLIASAYVQDVKTFMFDEPLSSLDPKESLNILKVLEELKKEGKTVIIVTHNISPFFRIKTKIVAIKNGKIVNVDKLENISSLLFKTFDINFRNIRHSKGDIFIPDETK